MSAYESYDSTARSGWIPGRLESEIESEATILEAEIQPEATITEIFDKATEQPDKLTEDELLRLQFEMPEFFSPYEEIS